MKEFEIKEFEINAIYRAAFLKAACFLQIDNPELKSNFELHECIKNKDLELMNAIETLFQNYQNYYFFTQAITSAKKYELNLKDTDLLNKHKMSIETARSQLLQLLSKK